MNIFDSLKRYDQHELDTSISPEFQDEYDAYANGPRHDRGTTETAELVSQLNEENTDAVKKYRFDQQDELKEIRPGQILSSRDFLKRLNTIIPARYTGYSRQGMTALRVLVPTENGGEWKFVCGVQAGYMPEFSTMYFDSHNLPTSEMYRGWRTVLIRLITGGFIDERKVHKLFGEAIDHNGRRYREQLYYYRQGRG